MKTPVLPEWNGNVKAREKKTRHQLTNLQFVWVFSPSASSISFNNWIIDLWRLWHVMTNVCSFPNRCPFSERNTWTAAQWNWNLFLKWQAIFSFYSVQTQIVPEWMISLNRFSVIRIFSIFKNISSEWANLSWTNGTSIGFSDK